MEIKAYCLPCSAARFQKAAFKKLKLDLVVTENSSESYLELVDNKKKFWVKLKFVLTRSGFFVSIEPFIYKWRAERKNLTNLQRQTIF